MIRALASMIALPLLAAPAGHDQLAGRIAGPSQRCVDFSRLQGPSIEEDGTILYRQNGRRTWRAEVAGRCPGLRPLNTLIVQVQGAQLCGGDRFQVLQTGTTIPSAYCRFERFVPYDKPIARND